MGAALVRSSYIPSLGAAATRNADVLPFPFPARPQAMTVYVRFVELGSSDPGASGVVVFIGNAAGNAPGMDILFLSGGAGYSVRHFNLVSVSATLAVAPTTGDSVELLAHLNADGSVDLEQSINSAVSTKSATSGANALASRWSGQFLWFNSEGISIAVGFAGYRNVVIHRGVQSLATMRRLAGVI